MKTLAQWAREQLHADDAGAAGECVFCGRRTDRVAANGKPCCQFCDDLPGKEPL